MKLYFHLAESGLSLSDLSLRIYDGVSPVSFPSLSLMSISSAGTDYELDGIPSLFQSNNWTVTIESPSGVYHAYRLGLALSQPLHVIIPIRELFSDPITSLAIRIFKDGTETTPLSGDVVRLSSSGEYAVSGWSSTPAAEQWSVRWSYNGLVYALQWTGSTSSSSPGAGTFYQEIRAVHSPIPYQIDGDNRQLFSCNFLAKVISPTAKFEDEIEEILRTGNIIPSGEVLYIGPKVALPKDDGSGHPFCVLLATGGYEPEETHDSKRENRGLQIITCAMDYQVARDRAELVWHYLDGLRNVFVTLP